MSSDGTGLAGKVIAVVVVLSFVLPNVGALLGALDLGSVGPGRAPSPSVLLAGTLAVAGVAALLLLVRRERSRRGVRTGGGEEGD